MLTRSAVAAVALVQFVACVAPVLGQIREIDPKWVAVSSDAADLHCDDFRNLYRVHTARGGDLFLADGASDKSVRVRYAPDMPAYVPAAEAEREGAEIVLKRDSKLRAVNRDGKRIATYSWHSVYKVGSALSAGTRLQLLSVEKSKDDRVEGFLVRPPQPPAAAQYPYAYIDPASIRDATPQEVERHLAAIGTVGDPASDPTPAGPSEVTPEPIPEPEQQADPITNTPDEEQPATDSEDAAVLAVPVTDPSQGDESPAAAAGDADSTQSQTPAESRTAEPVAAPVTDPASEPSSDPATESEQPAADPSNTPAETPVEILIDPVPEGGDDTPTEPLSIAELEAEFQRIRGLGREELDAALDGLVAEFRRTRGVTEQSNIRAALQRRIDWLEFRRETRDQRRALAAALAEADADAAALAERAERLRAERGFTLVGRLVPSSLYNGERLPLMYRVEADGPIGRTLAYFRPARDQNVTDLVGTLVGIRGEIVVDEGLGLRIIRATEIETLTSID